MRSSGDVLRSFKKYVSERVLLEYEVRLSSEEGAWARPFCRVGWTTPITVASIGARQVENRRTLQVVAWPEESETPDDAYVSAEALVDRMFDAFSMGMHAPSYAQDRGRAHPLRVPLYDFSGVGAHGEVTELAREATDFARIPEPPNIGDTADPDTDLSRLVVADLRVMWTRSVGVAPGGLPVVTVGVQNVP